MKQLLLILLVFLSLSATGQTTYIGAPNSTVETKGGFKVDSGGIQLPVLSPTKRYLKGMTSNGVVFISSVDSLPVFMKANSVKKILTVFDSATSYISPGQVGQPNGVASLDGSGVVPSAQLPAITISGQVYIDTNQAQMLSHSAATPGALSVRTDSSSALYVLTAAPYSTRANWALTQGNGVSAFNGRTGAINPRSGDYITDSVTEGVNNLYATTARTQAVIASDTTAGWVVSGSRLRDTAAAVRAASSGGMAIGGTVTGATAKNMFFANGNKLGQSNTLTYDTAVRTIIVKDPSGNSRASLAGAPTFSALTLSSGTGPYSITLTSYEDGSGAYIGMTTATNGCQILAGTGNFQLPSHGGIAALTTDIPLLGTSWVKLNTLTYADFATASTSRQINSSYTLPAKSVVNAVVVNVTTGFNGGGIASYLLNIGGTISGFGTKYGISLNVFGATNIAYNNKFGLESMTSSSVITVTANSTGANLSAATQGVVDIYLLINTLP